MTLSTDLGFLGFILTNSGIDLKILHGQAWYTGIDLPENWTNKEQKELESYIEPLRLC